MVGSGALKTLLDVAGNSLTIAARSVTRPTATFSAIEIKHGNETWKMAGKTNWASEDIEVVFEDVIPSGSIGSGSGDKGAQYSVAAIMYDWQNLIQNITNGSGALPNTYKSNMIVTQYNPAAQAIERYVYHGAWPQNVRYGENWDYTQEDAGNIVTVTFKCDKIYRVVVDSNVTPGVTSVVNTIADEDGLGG